MIGNYIGLDAGGTLDRGNATYGIGITSGGANTVGGTAAGERNVISGNDQYGVGILGGGGSTVIGNYIGTDANGTAAVPNTIHGVLIGSSASGNTIGGTTSAARNIIFGNTQFGVHITNSGSDNNTVLGNYIGTDVNGTADLGNGTHGIRIEDSASNNVVGGTRVRGKERDFRQQQLRGLDRRFGNQQQCSRQLYRHGRHRQYSIRVPDPELSRRYHRRHRLGRRQRHLEQCDGVWIQGASTNTTVQGNLIGVGADGTTNLGNSGQGVNIRTGTTGNKIGGTASGAGNTIAFNGDDGVRIETSTSLNNAILGNSIHDNGAIGIDLEGAAGVDANDSGDGDTGPNGLQNYPVLTSATLSSTTILGTLNSAASTTYRLEFFSSTACDGTGSGEGETYLGFVSVTTDGSGDATFTTTFTTTAPTDFMTATATDASNNTSEVSQCLTVTKLSEPTLVTLGGSSSEALELLLDWNDVTGASSYTLQYATQSDFSDSVEVMGLTASQFPMNVLLADGTCYWCARALGSSTASRFSSSDSFVVIPLFGQVTLLVLAAVIAGSLWWRR